VPSVNEEIQRLLKAKFIRVTKYIEWLSNIVPVLQKIGKTRVCRYFRDLSKAALKDEYHMLITNVLIDVVAKSKIFFIMDG